MNKDSIKKRLDQQKGHVGLYYKNLITEDVMAYHAHSAFLAASVIKLPIFMSLSKWCNEGRASMDEKIKVRREDMLPISGALTLFTGEPIVDVRTLCNLMISLSDNTATNILIKKFGIDAYNAEFLRMGLKCTRLYRVLFDDEAAAKGLENKIVPEEMGYLLEQIYKREFVSKEVSANIEDTLMMQQVNHKICGIIGDEVPVAHKTGEDDNLTNDVGLVYTKQPFIICFTGHDTNVPEFENLIRHVTKEIFDECNQADIASVG